MVRAKKPKETASGPAPDRTAWTHRWCIRVVLCSLLAGFMAVAGRLVQLQVDPDLKFSEEDLRHIGWQEIQIPRGDILDRRGRVLATDRQVKSLFINPSSVPDPYHLVRYLIPRLDMPEEELLERLALAELENERRRFMWIKRRLSDSECAALDTLEDDEEGDGLGLKTETVRFYPEGELAAHVLGFANREGIGCEGVELAFDKYLRSVAGKRVSRVDAKRNFLEALTLEYIAPTGGNDVHLTLDASIQFTLEQELDRAMERNKSPRAMGIVLDPQTGAILAFASRPAFDPNRYGECPPELYKNHGLVDVFEPGSSFKIVTASAALEQGLVTTETRIDCENGAFNPYGHRIRDYHPMGADIPFWKCFAESSNIAMIKVGAMLGPERLAGWIRRFGFGQQTSRDFAGESPGIFRPVSQWSRLSMGSLPMGQEIAVTMPQLARAFCAIANGGLLIEPYLVERVVGPDGGIEYVHEPADPVRILSEETAATMRELCHLVVTHGTGKPAAIKEYRVGGKTGTAQVALTNGRGFAPGKYTTIFAGFAPVSQPRICAVIVLHEPQIKLHFGSYCCGPVFSVVVRDALIEMGCPEDPTPEAGPALGTMLADAAGALEAADADTVVARAQTVAADAAEDASAEGLDGLELVVRSGDSMSTSPPLPNFAGMSKREAWERVVTLGLPWDPQGAGHVIAQDPPPGTPLEDVVLCRLVFSNEPAATSDDAKRTGPNASL